MDDLSPLISIEKYFFVKSLASITFGITFIYVFFNCSFAFFTCRTLVSSTCQTGAYVSLYHTCLNHRWRFSRFFSSIGTTHTLIRISFSHLISLNLTTYPTKHVQLSMCSCCLFLSQHSISCNKDSLIAVQ